MMMTIPVVGIPKRYAGIEATPLHVFDHYRYSILLSRLESKRIAKSSSNIGNRSDFFRVSSRALHLLGAPAC